MSKKTKKPLTKKAKVWILVAALSVFLAAAVTAGAILVPMLMGNPADPKVRWYSEEETEFTISTADELYDLAYLSSKYNFEGQTIKLGADIVINDGDASTWGSTPPSRLWYPIANFNGTFDGQGHTISGLYGVSFNEEMGLFSHTDKRAVVKNLRVVNSYLKSSGEHGTGFIASNGGGTFENIYVDGIIHSDNWNNGGIIGCVDLSGDTVITNCWFAGKMILVSDQGRVAGGIVGDVMPESGIVSISHCLNTGSFTAEAITHTGRGRLMDIGGIVGRASSGTTNITDCFANTKIESECMVGAGGLIGSAGKGKTNLSHCFYVKTDDTNAVGYRYNQTVGDVYTYTEEYVTGFEAYSWTTLDFENYWAVNKEGTPVLKTFAKEVPSVKGVKKMVDSSWYSKRNTATITTLEQLRALHVISQWDNFSGKTIYLGADIIVQEGDANEWGEKAPEIEWKGLSSANVMFAGTFDGLGHTISGLYQKRAANGLGLFVACTDGAVIRNLRVENSYFETNNVAVNNQTYSYIGSITAYARGTTIDSCYSNAIMVSDGYFCGGMVGLMRNGKANFVTNCWFDGKVNLHGVNTGMRGGGIVGCVWNVALTMSHCLYTGEMTGESWAWGANEGIMVGYPNDKAIVTVEDSLCAGTLTVLDGKKDGNGMICGRLSGTATVTFDSVFAIKTPDPAKVEGEEKQWFANWGLTGARDSALICSGPAAIFSEKYLTGIAAYQYTDLDFNNFWAIDLNGHPVLQTFMGEDEEIIDVSGYSKKVDYSWYNSADTLYIGTALQLNTLSLLASGDSFKDKTIVLTNDISLNTGNAEDWIDTAPANKWTPIGNADLMFQGTFNGAGHTISGLYVSQPGNGLGLFGMVRGATIKNLKLTNSLIRSTNVAASMDSGKIVSYSYIGAIAAYGANATFDTIYTDAIVMNDGEMSGGIVGLANKVGEPVSFNNCWFDGTMISENAGPKKSDGGLYCAFAGGIIGLLRSTDGTITNCLSTGTFKSVNIPDGTWGTVAGGLVGRADCTASNVENNTLTIKNSFANIKIDGFVGAGGNCTVVSQCNTKVIMNLENVYAVTSPWKAINQWQSKEIGSGAVVTMAADKFTGSNAYIFAKKLDYDNYWTALEGKTPELKTFATGDKAPVIEGMEINLDWYDGTKSEYVLTTSADLLGLAILSESNNFNGITIKLGNDIVVNKGNAEDWATNAPAIEWTAIGDANPFAGTFDGQGYSISGLYAKNTVNRYASLFGHVYGGTVKNVRVVNSYLESVVDGEFDATTHFHNAASIIGRIGQAAKFENIYTDAILVGGKYAAMIAFQDHNSDGPTIKNCWFDGTIIVNNDTLTKGGFGGIMGSVRNEKTTTLENCLFTGKIVAGENMSGNYIGGLVGLAPYSAKLVMTNCLSAGQMLGVKSGVAGSVVGNNPGANTSVYTNVYAVTESATYAMGAGGSNFPVTKVPYAEIVGDLATSKLSGFDFSNTWTVVEGNVPVLKTFADLAEEGTGEATVSGLLVTAPTKTVYKVGTELILDGMTVTVIYSDYTNAVITEGYTVSGFDSTTAGTKKVTVTYNGVSDTFDVIVAAPSSDPTVEDILWYDGLKTEYVLNTLGEFKGFVKLAQTNDFSGITIKLGADIIWNEGNAADWATNAPANVWAPIPSFKGTFDGQGHKISGLYYQNTAGDKNLGLFATVENATIKNLVIDNAAMLSTSGSGNNGILVGKANGITVENVKVTETVTVTNSTHSGMVAYVTGTNPVSFKNVWMAGTITNGMWTARFGGLMGFCDNTNGLVITVDNCLFTGVLKQTHDTTTSENYVGGFVGATPANVKISVTNSLSAGTITKAAGATTYTGSVVGITSWRGASHTTFNNVYATRECYAIGTNRDSSNYTGKINFVNTAEILGGNARWLLKNLDFTADGAWIAVEDKLPELRTFSTAAEAPEVPDPTPVDPNNETTAWFDGTKTEYTITTVGEMKGLATLSQTNNFDGITIKLGADIVWNAGNAADWEATAPENTWQYIGSATVPFKGIFDGQDHTISGVCIKHTVGGTASGMFPYVEGATIKNLTVDNSLMLSTAGNSWNGIIAGKANGITVENVKVTETVTVKNNVNVGLVGFAVGTGAVKFSNVWMDGTVTSAMWTVHAGGLLGFCENNNGLTITVENCLFTGAVKQAHASSTAENYAGGFIGATPVNVVLTITDSLSAGTVTTAAPTIYAGSVVGPTSSGGAAKTVFDGVYATKDCYSVGTYRAPSTYTGTIELVEKANILGGLARNTLSGLDFTADGAWIAVEDKLPELRYFSDAEEAPEVGGGEEPGTPDTPVTPADPNEETIAWYDGTKTEYTISTVGELKGFVTLSKTDTFAGITVKLGADIVWNEGDAADWATTAPANVWNAIGNGDSGFVGTFDGQGHTISGLYYNGNGYATLVGRLYSTGVVKNIAVVNSYLKSTSGAESFHHSSGIVGRMNNGATLTNVYTNAILVAEKGAGMVGFNDGGTVNISNCWFDGTIDATNAAYAAGMVTSVKNSTTHNITNCLFTGTITGGKAGGYYGGIVGIGPYDAKLMVTNCLVDGDLTGVTAGTVGSVIGNNPGHNYSVYTNVFATTETHANLKGAGGATFPVTGLARAEILGSKATAKLTGFDFTNTWATVNLSNPVLKSFVDFAPEIADPNEETTAWFTGDKTEYTISTLGELKGLSTLAQTNNFAGITIKLGADIVINEGDAADWATTAPETAWAPIGTVSMNFAGTFDGQGHTISGLYYVATTRTHGGLFGYTNGATIQNLVVENSYLNAGGFYANGSAVANFTGAGTIAGYANNTTFRAIHVADDVTLTKGTDLGGIAGQVNGTATPVFEQCWFSGTILLDQTPNTRAGGIYGFGNSAARNIQLTNCLFDGVITGTLNSGIGDSYAGGLFSMGNYSNSAVVTNCLAIGTVDATTSKGAGSVTCTTAGGGNMQYVNVYYITGTTPMSNPNKVKAGSNLENVALNDLLGDAAATTLVGFDFTDVWAVAEDATPVLKAFVPAVEGE